MSERKPTINQRLNVRQRRRKALHELHARKMLTARMLGASTIALGMLNGVKSRHNTHMLQKIINELRGKP